MAIRKNLQLKLSGDYWQAFRLFCERRKIGTSRDGLRAVIEVLPEYQALQELEDAEIIADLTKPNDPEQDAIEDEVDRRMLENHE